MRKSTEKTNKRTGGFAVRRMIAMLLVVMECFSVIAVGIPAGYAQDPEEVIVETVESQGKSAYSEEVVMETAAPRGRTGGSETVVTETAEPRGAGRTDTVVVETAELRGAAGRAEEVVVETAELRGKPGDTGAVIVGTAALRDKSADETQVIVETVEVREESADSEMTEDPETGLDNGERKAEEIDYSAGSVTVSGNVPEGTVVETQDVSALFADFDPRAYSYFGPEEEPLFLGSAAGSQRSIVTDYRVLTAQDISLSLEGEEIQPEPGSPLQVTITDPAISEDLKLQLWHVHDDGRTEQITDFTVEGDSLSFEADSFSAYVVVQVTLTTTVTTGDGRTYSVTVTYDDDTGVGTDAELVVSEITENDEDYASYVERSAEALGTEAEKLVFARPFDISLLDPSTGSSIQPNRNLTVSVRLLDEELDEESDIDVLHFLHSDEVETLSSAMKGDAVEFETDGFSIYVFAERQRCKYTFHTKDSNGGFIEYPIYLNGSVTPVYSQTVTSPSELIIPQLPSTEEGEFAGWYKGVIATDGSGSLIISDTVYDFFAEFPDDPDGSGDVTLYPKFKEFVYVIFHGQYDTTTNEFPVIYSRRAELVTTTTGGPGTEVKSAKVKIDDLSASYAITSDNTKRAFWDWSATPITRPGALKDDEGEDVEPIATDADGCIEIQEDTPVYPIFKEIHWLNYYAAQSGMSALYVAPAWFYAGDAVAYYDDEHNLLPMPVSERDGYIFQGWYLGSVSGTGSEETVSYGHQITKIDEFGNHVLMEGLILDAPLPSILNGKLYLREDTTLYAKWGATYRLVYWKQKADGTYEYAETVTKTASIGDEVSVEEGDRADNRYAGYQCLTWDEPKRIGNTKEITVLNVYYDLDGHTGSGEKHKLIFADSMTDDPVEMPPEVEDLAYGTKLVKVKPANPTRLSGDGKEVYKFRGWFLDQACTIEADFSSLTMPDNDLTLWAGWTAVKFKVDIDTNYGALYPPENGDDGTGATYFNNTYDDEPIVEYTHITREFVESSSGTWYYVNHDRAFGGNPDRHTYYTQDPGLATEDTTFEYVPNAYIYEGWYEVYLDEDGNEIGEATEPYDFSQRTDHDTKLRLHWKRNDVYYLAYNAGDGKLADGEKEMLVPTEYSDYAEIVLTESAIAPRDNTIFVGWKVKHGEESDRIYAPGEVFTLRAENAIPISGKEIVYLEAVYVLLDTATIRYDANGGVIDDSVDYGQIYDTSSQTRFSPIVNGLRPDGYFGENRIIAAHDNETAIVTSLINNSEIRLSDGTGFSKDGRVFLGWSTERVCDADAEFFPPKDSEDNWISYGVDLEEPTTLYAVWGVKVTYHLLPTDGASADFRWSETGTWGAPYVLEGGNYVQAVHEGTAASAPPYTPVYTGSGNPLMFYHWRTAQYTAGGAQNDDDVYAFSEPVNAPLELYAYWDKLIEVPVNAIDVSAGTPVYRPDWVNSDILAGSEPVILREAGLVTPGDDNYEYELAFVAAAPANLTSIDALSRDDEVIGIYYDSSATRLFVTYADGTAAPLGDNTQIYFVYCQKKTLNIAYKTMLGSGALNDVVTDEAAATGFEVSIDTESYDVAAKIVKPLEWVGSYTHYAFAIGSQNATNAGGLHVITDASDSDERRPALWVRNTWLGFQYSEDEETWLNCGYNPMLYVIYYEQKPTVIMFQEKTQAPESAVGQEFTYELKITQLKENYVYPVYQTLEGETWVNTANPEIPDTPTSTETEVLYRADNGTGANDPPYVLKSGEAQSAILLYGTSRTEEIAEEGTNTRTLTVTDTVITQTAEITQTVYPDFTTSIDVGGIAYTASQVKYMYTSDETGGTKTVTYTNTYKPLSVEAHVALLDDNGIVRRDALRSTDEADYRFDLSLGESATLLTRLPQAELWNAQSGYGFGTILYAPAVTDDGVALDVDMDRMGVATVDYELVRSGDVYELILKDANGKKLDQLDGYELYYLYYRMPEIYYLEETSETDPLTLITGSVEEYGEVMPSSLVTYSHAPFQMNGEDVVQGQLLSKISADGLVISQTGNSFRMPTMLDDGIYERYLGYTRIGVSSGGELPTVETLESLNTVSDGQTLYLRFGTGDLQWSFTGAEDDWTSFTGTPTIYAIYAERGYDLQISKTVDTTYSGKDPIFTEATFELTIHSDSLRSGKSYRAEGADQEELTPDANGNIVLTVKDGSRIKLIGVERGEYTITEAGNENYQFTAKVGPIIGNSWTGSLDVTDNTSVTLLLDDSKKVGLTNSPNQLCVVRKTDSTTSSIFYTLKSAMKYVDDYTNHTASIVMLTDYLMPAQDTLDVPNGYNITLTRDSQKAVITRQESTKGIPLIENKGSLTLSNVTLEGSGITATAPMIQSSGDLTIGGSATIQHAISSGNGGAINATAGNITVEDGGKLTGNHAASGGAIYHAGNGTISVLGELTSNMSTGDGGAIYAAGGIFWLSGLGQISANSAGGNGGAIYVGHAEINIIDSVVIQNNTAQSGGAIYAAAGTITMSKTESGNNEPSIIGNKALANNASGNGGAIWVGEGSVTLSGGHMGAAGNGKNTATGKGGAIYTGSADVTVTGTAALKYDEAPEGGAIYTVSGDVAVSGGSMTENRATNGKGGAVYAGGGNVALSGGSLTKNRAPQGGGAVYAGTGNVAVSGGSLTENWAGTVSNGVVTVVGNGGAICADKGSVEVSEREGTTLTVTLNTATGKGGAFYVGEGDVTVTGGSVTTNTAYSNGGAFYAGEGHVTVTNSSLTNNTATANGGAIYAGNGNVELTGGSLNNNTAAANGGAVWMGKGTLNVNGETLSANKAINGTAVFINAGIGYFYSNTVISGNISSNGQGGALGVGADTVRLNFTGNAKVIGNKLGTGADAADSNVYLDKDSDNVIVVYGLEAGARIGVYVPGPFDGELFLHRGAASARFATFSSTSTNLTVLTNDRQPNLTAMADESAKKVFWGKSIKVEVRYRNPYDNYPEGFPPVAAGNTLYGPEDYYPSSESMGISQVAEDLYSKISGLTNSAVYGGAFLSTAGSFEEYLTRLFWDSTADEGKGAWKIEKRDGSTAIIGDNVNIVIYYAEPTYISIENNTNYKLNITGLSVGGLSVINIPNPPEGTVVGYGFVFAIDGAIQGNLPAVKPTDLQLKVGGNIRLLIPGGCSKEYVLKGVFETATGETIRLRRTGHDEEALTADQVVSGFTLTDSTRSKPGDTYEIIFGEDLAVCRIVRKPAVTLADNEEVNKAENQDGSVEYLFPAIKDAVAFAQRHKVTGNIDTIEMLTDYMLPSDDKIEIPWGLSIAFSTATEGTHVYSGLPDVTRATISRDANNANSFITAVENVLHTSVECTISISNLNFDGKSIKGNSDGGALATRDYKVTIDNVDFKNFIAGNGGAIFIEYGKINTGQNKSSFASGYDSTNAILTVNYSNFINCHSEALSNRTGGGAIWTNARVFNMDGGKTGGSFESCTAFDQGGAVFHRIDDYYPYRLNTSATVKNCKFTNCQAAAAGGLEFDAYSNTMRHCSFTSCYAATQTIGQSVKAGRNGGGLNIYIHDDGNKKDNTYVLVDDCEFHDCTAVQNGGALRSAALATTVQNSRFYDSAATKVGGGISLTNTNGTTSQILGCTIERCSTQENGGGVYCAAKEMIIRDYIPGQDNPEEGVDYSKADIVHTRIKDCTSVQNGGGVCHIRDVADSTATLTNVTVTNCTAKISNGGGGGIYSDAGKSLTLTNVTLENNKVTGNNGCGGGVYYNGTTDTRKTKTLYIYGCTLDENEAKNCGGGIYCPVQTLVIGDATVDGKIVHTTVKNCVSVNEGGGICHTLTNDGTSSTITNAIVSNCKTTSTSKKGGGGIYVNAKTLTMTGVTAKDNTATGSGGGLLYSNSSDKWNMSLTMRGCTVSGNTAGTTGGGIYTPALTVTVGDAEIERETVHTTISGNKAGTSGGGIYLDNNGRIKNAQNQEVDYELPSTASFTNCVIDGNKANGGQGGGIWTNYRSMTLTGANGDKCVVSNNSATSSGGGLYYYYKLNNATVDWYQENWSLTLDTCEFNKNSTGNQGGGIYTYFNTTLRNTAIINNTTTLNATNGAGMYLQNDRLLTIGTEIESGDDTITDSTTVKGNLTSTNEKSDLRLPEASGENQNCVIVKCGLTGEIYVVNAKKQGTRFGTSQPSTSSWRPAGLSDSDHISGSERGFIADNGVLYGIINRLDTTNKEIVWAGPPICKIVGDNGKLLYFTLGTTESGGKLEAIFDKLDDGTDATVTSNTAAFSLLRDSRENLSKRLYYRDENGFSKYTGNVFYVKMLVEEYEVTKAIKANPDNASYNSQPWMKIILTTETMPESEETDANPYGYRGRDGSVCTLIRTTSIGKGTSMITAHVCVTLQDITLDGNDISTEAYGTLISNPGYNNNNGNKFVTIELGNNATLKNAKTTKNGGAVYATWGNCSINGGRIIGCQAVNGGAVYMSSGYKTDTPVRGQTSFSAGRITNCKATGSGGGIFVDSNNRLTISGGSIEECEAVNGGGLYFGSSNSNATFTMSGGSILRNKATTKGGGIAFQNGNVKLYFSGRPYVTGNTCDTSLAKDQICNLRLDRDSYVIIETNNGGIKAGANIGVYVPDNVYSKRGVEGKRFGTYTTGDSTSALYGFVNDRNGLKGGLCPKPELQEGDAYGIYWTRIFSIKVSKEVVAGSSAAMLEDEQFLFRVTVFNEDNEPLNNGQLDSWLIDSDTGDFGEMVFHSNGEYTTAVFALKDGEEIIGTNLSEGLYYEVDEFLLKEDQSKRYAAMPMQSYDYETARTLTYDGTEYTVVLGNSYTGKVGENKDDSTVGDPYTSDLTFVNLLPVCKITDLNGKILLRPYTVGGKEYYSPAVYTELNGDDGAFKALESKLYIRAGNGITQYSDNGLQIHMLVPSYTLMEGLTLPSAADKTVPPVLLTTASKDDILFPFQGTGTAGRIIRGQKVDSTDTYNAPMFTVNANAELKLQTIILDGAKDKYASTVDGGIAKVAADGTLSIETGATLQNSRITSQNNVKAHGGAVYVAAGGKLVMQNGWLNDGTAAETGGTVKNNVSDGDGPGIYLATGSTMELSGSPSFGGTGTDSGYIDSTVGNLRSDTLSSSTTNGGWRYRQPRQDIYLEGTAEAVESLVITGALMDQNDPDNPIPAGSIWVWAEYVADGTEGVHRHYETLNQFAVFANDGVRQTLTQQGKMKSTLKAFRDAWDDDNTLNPYTEETDPTEAYLYGDLGDKARFIYWRGPKGSHHVILRKVTGTEDAASSLSGVLFTICKKGDEKPYEVDRVTINGETYTLLEDQKIKLMNLISGANGVFWVGELPYGEYDLYEGTATTPTFNLIVAEDTVENGEIIFGVPDTISPKS